MSNRNTWLILDSNFLCYRVRYTMKDMSFREIPTSIAYGFLQTILILQNTFKTKNIAFCFDSKHNKRKKIYPQYKASRKHNQPLTTEQEEEENIFRQQVIKLRRTYLPYLGFNNVFMQPGYESDDIMAKICYSNPDLDFIMVTADHDMFQCLNYNVRMFNPIKRKMWTVRRFKNEFGIIPDQWIDVKTLAGCTSDNISGLKGIGEKTALRYLKGELKTTSKAYITILDYNIFQSKENNDILSKLVTLPYPGTKPVTLKRDCVTNKKWNALCRKLGIKSLKLSRE